MSYIVVARKRGAQRLALFALTLVTHASAGFALLALSAGVTEALDTPMMVDLVSPLPPGDPSLPPGLLGPSGGDPSLPPGYIGDPSLPPGYIGDPSPGKALAPKPGKRLKAPKPAPKGKASSRPATIETTTNTEPADPNSNAIQAPETTSAPPASPESAVGDGDGDEDGVLGGVGY
ncbi:MAG: hypothetical protein LBJ76_04700, partial [Candidatus Accumulibacter sp.]|nr:hypothetical protein [Accumulibacter sp.]